MTLMLWASAAGRHGNHILCVTHGTDCKDMLVGRLRIPDRYEVKASTGGFSCSSSAAVAACSVSGPRSLSAAVGGPLRLMGQSMKTTSSDAKNVPSHQTARHIESVQPRLLRLFVMRP